jgi:hypothetical protein
VYAGGSPLFDESTAGAFSLTRATASTLCRTGSMRCFIFLYSNNLFHPPEPLVDGGDDGPDRVRARATPRRAVGRWHPDQQEKYGGGGDDEDEDGKRDKQPADDTDMSRHGGGHVRRVPRRQDDGLHNRRGNAITNVQQEIICVSTGLWFFNAGWWHCTN